MSFVRVKITQVPITVLTLKFNRELNLNGLRDLLFFLFSALST